MTEDAAKLKWCPMIRNIPLGVGENYRGVTTRDNPANYERNCIASGCMMWHPTDNEYPSSGFGKVESKPAGYCGLAK